MSTLTTAAPTAIKLKINPYLNFEGRCEEALEFYRRAVGAEVTTLLRVKDNPETNAQCQPPPGTENKVLHASFNIGENTIMASDCRCSGKPNFEGVSLALAVPNDRDAKRLFDALTDGGQVWQPLTKTFFASSFGVVADRFGVSWMIFVPTPVTA